MSTAAFAIPSIEEVTSVIADRNAPIEYRMRCLFAARHHRGVAAARALEGAVGDASVLLVHEAAYLMGQLGFRSSIPCLVSLLQDMSQDCMVRHEAAEALAAIGLPESIDVVRQYLNDVSAPVRETCELALRSLEEKKEDAQTATEAVAKSPIPSVDPVAKVNREIKEHTTAELRSILLDAKNDLYYRYEALFELRDRPDAEAAEAIIAAMKDTSSALFRHEVAFVLGQLATPEASQALVECLESSAEHPMARHEAALALGAVACSTDGEARKAVVDHL